MEKCINYIKERGKLRVGVAGTMPGKSYLNPQSNKMEGFEADLARLIARELFAREDQVEFIKILRTERISALKENRVDLTIYSYAITEDRLTQIDFSNPYFIDKVAFLIINEGSIHRFSDLKGKRIALVENGLPIKEFSEYEPVIIKSESDGVQTLRDRNADAFALSHTTLNQLIDTLSDANQFSILDTGSQFTYPKFAIGIKKGCSDLVDFVNASLSKFESNGILKTLLKRHGWIV